MILSSKSANTGLNSFKTELDLDVELWTLIYFIIDFATYDYNELTSY